MMPPIAILAGGLATRMRPLTESTPKALLPVNGRPFIHWQIELLRRHGVSDVVMCVGHLGEQVEASVRDGSEWGLRVRYSYDGDELLGTGGALRRALPMLGSEFFVTYGDAYLDCDYRSIWQAFGESDAEGLMTVFENANRWGRSNVILERGEILLYDKNNPSPDMRHIDYGVGMLRASALDRYPIDRRFDFADVYRDLLSRGSLIPYLVDKRFYEIGNAEGLADLDRHLRQMSKE